MKYTVVTGKLFDLDEKVNKKIKLGWKPIGGVSVWTEGILYTEAAQAMVKEDT